MRPRPLHLLAAIVSAFAISSAGITLVPAADATPAPASGPYTAVAATAQATPAEQGALNWAQARLGQDLDDGYCLQFVVDAYAQGSGVDIGSADSALDYWTAHPDLQHGDTNPPLGALVFWGATSTNPYGHVGIALGDGTVISTYEETTHTIHIFSIAARNTAGYPYLGWMQVA